MVKFNYIYFIHNPVDDLCIFRINNTLIYTLQIPNENRVSYGDIYEEEVYQPNTILTIPITDTYSKLTQKTKLNPNETLVVTTKYAVKPTKQKPLKWTKLSWDFLKFKYHGKGYKIKKFNTLGKLTFRFGKSHWTKALYNPSLYNIRRTKKNTYCVLNSQNLKLNFLLQILKNVKGVNRYTKRGVRLTRQSIKKRFGKISQASSVYK